SCLNSLIGVYIIEPNYYHVILYVGMDFISFCSLDSEDSQIFGFINRSNGENFCHVFKGVQNSPKQILELLAES
ncbi:hypothetical protein, partial [Escherichia coli]|uniref:hypothetical protein n=1 Tax=Escherichia coli TaxID=562 RepID=UPI003CE4ECF2